MSPDSVEFVEPMTTEVVVPAGQRGGLTPERLGWLRDHAGMPARFAAEALGVSVSTISRWRAQVEAGDVEAGDVEAGDVEAGDVEAGDVEAMLALASKARAARLSLAQSQSNTDDGLGAEPPLETSLSEGNSVAPTSSTSPDARPRNFFAQQASRWRWAGLASGEAFVAGEVLGPPVLTNVQMGNSTVQEVQVMVGCGRGRAFRVGALVASATGDGTTVTCGVGAGLADVVEGDHCQFVGSVVGGPLRLSARRWRVVRGDDFEPEVRLVLVGTLTALRSGNRPGYQEASVESLRGATVRVVLPEFQTIAPGTPVVCTGRASRAGRPVGPALSLVSIRLDERRFGR